MSVANQNIVIIQDRASYDDKNIFFRIHTLAYQQAATLLSGEHLKLWLYLERFKPGFKLELSQKECEKWGLKKDSYYAAKKKLEDLHYLVRESEGSNIYKFYEVPQKEDTPNGVSEIPNDSENQKEKYSEIPNTSGFQNLNSATQKNFSENPQRNTIYNTKYNTIYSAGQPQTSSEIPKEEKIKIDINKLPEVKKEEAVSAVKDRYILQDDNIRVFDTYEQIMYRIV